MNCIVKEANVTDLVFLKDYPELIENSVTFFHKISFLTSSKEEYSYNGDDLVDFSYIDGSLCISVKCQCESEFSPTCVVALLKILCKIVMIVQDGAYPLSCMSLPFPLGCSLSKIEEEEENNLDGVNRKFCSDCHTPELYCTCLASAFNKTQFLAQLTNFNLCHACATFMPGCKCRHRLYFLYKFYFSKIVDGKIARRLNDVKRLAYLSSCNVQICFNCNRAANHCICDASFRVLYPAV